MIFNDPDLNLRAEYSLFDRQTGRPVCVGNGETCQRLTNQGVEQHPVHHLIYVHWLKEELQALWTFACEFG
jgi:hypothetical protein